MEQIKKKNIFSIKKNNILLLKIFETKIIAWLGEPLKNLVNEEKNTKNI